VIAGGRTLRVLVAGAVAGTVAVLALIPEGESQQYQTLGPLSCTNANCHPNEANWWRGDPHQRSAGIYLDGGADFVAMARAFGIAEGDEAALNRTCFGCHGTVMSGAESDEIEYGVSCESCHGPGSGYRDPHQKNYDGGVAAGMLPLKDVKRRAAMCIDCHLVTDQKLLRIHPAGWTKSGKYTRGVKGVSVHWKELAPEDTDPGPFDAILADAVVVIPDPPPAPAGAPAQAPAAARTRVETVVREVVVPGGAWIYTAPKPLRSLDLSGMPATPDSTGVDTLLLLLKGRIERIYAAIDSAYAK
jgi:hypothetical protein